MKTVTERKIEFIDLKTQYQKIADEVDSRIKKVLEHGQYILGPEVSELETRLAEYIGVKHCITIANGTEALMIALMACGVQPGDEVITTPFTFISTAEIITLLGAKPVFVDIDPRTYNINPQLIEQVICSRTKAIIPVSLFGQCADLEAINQIAAQYKLPVIEDGAQSFGATYKGKKSCGLTTIGCTSFFPSKPLGCYGDGGACFTNDNELAQIMLEIRVHGQSRRYYHSRIGLNGRLDTLQAAILLAKFPLFQQEVVARAQIGQHYTNLLNELVVTPYIESYNTSVYAQYTIQVPDRDQIQLKLNDQGIPTAIHYPLPLHLQPAFAYLNYFSGSFPVAEKIAQNVLSLPMHGYLNSEDQERIVENLKNFI